MCTLYLVSDRPDASGAQDPQAPGAPTSNAASTVSPPFSLHSPGSSFLREDTQGLTILEAQLQGFTPDRFRIRSPASSTSVQLAGPVVTCPPSEQSSEIEGPHNFLSIRLDTLSRYSLPSVYSRRTPLKSHRSPAAKDASPTISQTSSTHSICYPTRSPNNLTAGSTFSSAVSSTTTPTRQGTRLESPPR